MCETPFQEKTIEWSEIGNYQDDRFIIGDTDVQHGLGKFS